MNYNKKVIVKHDKMKYNTMNVIKHINRYEMRCDDMMNVHLPTYYITINWYHLV